MRRLLVRGALAQYGFSMCYSVMIQSSLKEVSRQFEAALDLEAFRALLRRRITDPTIKIPRGIDRYFLSGPGEDAAMARLILQFYGEEDARMAEKQKEAREEIAALKQKPTAANKKKIVVREKKIEALESKRRLALEDPDPLDDRVFPCWYAPVVAVQEGRRVLFPMRYRLRAPDGGEIPSKYNLFNARSDSLLTARTWTPLFGRQHAIFPFTRFFEWVERDGAKKEIHFSPEGREFMWGAALYLRNGADLFSFAMVTDEPPEEVAEAGHDRCPVFLSAQRWKDWLEPGKFSREELLKMLKEIEKAYYFHALAA